MKLLLTIATILLFSCHENDRVIDYPENDSTHYSTDLDSVSYIKGIDTVSDVGTISAGTWTIRPCDTDTVNGTLIYNIQDEDGSRETYGDGHWVGKCGPGYSMQIPDGLFILGMMKRSWGECHENHTHHGDSSCKYIQQTAWSTSNGKFYDYEWKEVKAEDVYCLYRLNKNK